MTVGSSESVSLSGNENIMTVDDEKEIVEMMQNILGN